VEPTAGRWARFVGVIPDAGQPGGVAPVWGSAETLHLAAQAKLPDGQRSDPLLATFNVHPEPGQPTALACRQHDGQPCGDTFRYWPGYLAGTMLYDSYRLVDGHGNTTFGYTDTHATQPGEGIGVDFKPQIGTYGSPAAYAVGVTWPGGASRPSGQKSACLSVTYPADPGGDWPAGAVSRAITLDFQGGETRMLIAKQNYDARFAADDGAMPMTVSPGAGEGGLPPSPAGDTPRLVLLAVRGTQVPWAIVGGGDEPSLEPFKVYRSQLGTWQKVQASPGSQDVVLDTQPGGTFRLSLVDGSFNVVPETAFRVHRCPRGEHLTAESPPPEPCTLGAVDSEGQTGILPSLELNPADGARGYLGIELTKAPVNPGTYYILVESTGATPYRIRQGADLVRRAGQESEYLGAYMLCTVAGGEFLDENFQRIDPDIVVNQPLPVWVRFSGSFFEGGVPAELPSTLESRWPTGEVFCPAQSLTLARVAATGQYLGRALVVPPGAGECGGAAPPLDPMVALPGGPGVLRAVASVNGGAREASANTAVPRKLKIEFLDENGVVSESPVVRVHARPDPADSSHSLYAELCKVRVQAVIESTGAPDPTARGWVVLSEAADEDSDPRFPRSYNRVDLRPAATVLTDAEVPNSIPWEQRDYKLEALDNHGKTGDLDLWGLAAPRKDRQDTQLVTWAAKLIAKPALSARLRGFTESAVAEVPQWADQGSYLITEGAGGALQVSFREGSNQLPDWLDAAFWNRIAEMRGSSDALVRDVAEAVDGMTADPSGGLSKAWAFVEWGSRYVRYNVKKIDSDVIRLDQPFARQVYFGLGIAEQRFLSSNVAHEARHCWQHTLTDLDGDHLPGSVPDPAAQYLVDSPSLLRPQLGGTNPEFDFSGDGPGLDDRHGDNEDSMAAIRAAVERDAVRWEGRTSGATVDSGLHCAEQLSGSLLSNSSAVYDLADAPAYQVLVDALLVGAQATDRWSDRDGGYSSQYLPGVLVQAKVETVAAPGTTEPGVAGARLVEPGSGAQVTWVLATTAKNGFVALNAVPAPGLNVFSVTMRGLNNEGDGSASDVESCSAAGTRVIWVRVRGI